MPWRPTALALLIAAWLAGCQAELSQTQPLFERITIADRTFNLELALDDEARYQGLSDRESIPEDGGMLFVFPNAAERTFVMRRCLVPIDIIFLGPNGRIVSMHQMQVEPYDRSDWRLTPYRSGWPAQFAIELRGGMLEELALAPGQRIELPLERLKAMAR